MIVGIGVDTVDIARFERSLARTPALRSRLFTPAEAALPLASLAARFAAKEALIKALGDSGYLGWHDLEVQRDELRAPSFVATPGLEAAFAERGADRAHLSFTHDAGIATAFVVLEQAAARLDRAAMSAAEGTLGNDYRSSAVESVDTAAPAGKNERVEKT